VDWEENRKGYEAPADTNVAQNFEKPKEEETVE
jgi:hypothetical protein